MMPLVTCIMPTANRRSFVQRAIKLFFDQDYANKQLLIIEDGTECCEDIAVPVTYQHLGFSRRSIGEKRNIACGLAKGDLIAHWDDDDWHSPKRLSVQVAAMLEKNARLCGADKLVFYEEAANAAYLYQSVRYPWLAGGTLMYEKKLWEEIGGFKEQSSGEDTAFVDAVVRRRTEIAVITDPSLYVAMIHGNNAETKRRDSQWGGFDEKKVQEWIQP